MTSKLLGSFTIWSKKAEKISGHPIYKTQILDVHAQITIDGHKEFLFFQSLAYTNDFKWGKHRSLGNFLAKVNVIVLVCLKLSCIWGTLVMSNTCLWTGHLVKFVKISLNLTSVKYLQFLNAFLCKAQDVVNTTKWVEILETEHYGWLPFARAGVNGKCNELICLTERASYDKTCHLCRAGS